MLSCELQADLSLEKIEEEEYNQLVEGTPLAEVKMTKFAALETLTMTLPELLKTLSPGDELVLTENHKPVATLVAKAPEKTAQPRQPGNCRGLMSIIADDKEHLRDFAEYM